MQNNLPLIDPKVLEIAFVKSVPESRQIKVHSFLKSISRNSRIPVNTVVLHYTAGGTAESSIEHLRSVGFSYHYIIERDGIIHKCLPLSRGGQHVGLWNSKFPPTRSQCVNGPGTVNSSSVAISFANRGNDGDGYKESLTLSQLLSLFFLLSELKSHHPDIKYLTTHHECAKNSRPYELKEFPLERVADRFGLYAWRSK